MSKLIPLLMLETGLAESDLRKIISNAPRRYKTYAIPKRNGGLRPISQPALELKVLQRAMLRILDDKLNVHTSAIAYRPNLSIKQNAQMHAANGPILKFDFKNFFPSLRSSDWKFYCDVHNIFENQIDIEISTNIFFHQITSWSLMNLAIGAPSSPHLSNVLLYEFDELVNNAVAQDNVTYSRYADDMTFSAAKTGYLQHVERKIKKIIKELTSPKLSINVEKTVFATKKYRRSVTGLILTNDGKISIGHERKKIIRAAVHQAISGELDVRQKSKLAGYLAFIDDVEPEFVNRLILKYGFDQIARIRKSESISRQAE